MKNSNAFDFEGPNIPIDDLGGRYKNRWTEESFNFEIKTEKQIPIARTNDYLGLSIKESKIKFLSYFIIACFVFIFCRLFYIQILNGDQYREFADGNRIRVRPIPAERGIIFDRYGRELVQNVPSFSLSIVPQDLPRNTTERYEIIKEMSAISGVSQENINALLNKYKLYSYESLIIKENLNYNTAIKLYVQNADLPGILIEKGTKRHYMVNDSSLSLSHLLGYLSKLNDDELKSLKDSDYSLSSPIGRVGLEKYYEQYLRGKNGRKKVEVNAVGKEQNILAEESPQPGFNLKLALDLDAQQELETDVRRVLASSGKKAAAAIAMEPETGAILAMVSWPTFDSNEFAGGIDAESFNNYMEDSNQPLFNRAIGGTYPSGSTVKLIVAAAALQEKIVSPKTVFLSTGGLEVGGHLFRDWKAGGHGTINVTKALAWSVNTFFYYIGGGYGNFVGLGANKIVEYMDKFNLGKKTEIDLYGENTGFVPSKKWKMAENNEKWYVGDTYNLSIGQGNLLVTPLQVAVWTAAIANGGKVIAPHLGDAIISSATKEEKKIETKILNQDIISAENINIVKHGLRQCVTDGSCGLLLTLPFSSGGKTGTAQWSGSKKNHAWFTSFAPFDHPKIVVTVLVEEGEEGSSVAMPIARNFLSWWGKKYLK